MKLHVNNKLLICAAERCSAAADSKTAHPHTGKVMLSAVVHDDDKSQCMQAYATDLILQVDTAVTARVERAVEAAVDCRRLMSVAAAMPAGEVTLMRDAGRLVLTCAQARAYALPTIDPKAFPQAVEPKDDAARVEVPGGLLAQAISRVQHCIDATTAREHLRGVYVDIADGELHAVAIGAYANAFATEKSDKLKGEPWAALLPLNAIKLVQSLCPDEDEVALIAERGQIFIETGDTLVGGLLPHANYPDWRVGLGNTTRTRIARVAAGPFQNAVKAVCAGRSSQESALYLHVEGSKLSISLVGDACNAEDQIPVETLDRDDADWFFDPAHVLDTVRGANEDFVLEDFGQGLIVSAPGYVGMAAGRVDPRERAAADAAEMAAARVAPQPDAKPDTSKRKPKPGTKKGNGKGQAEEAPTE